MPPLLRRVIVMRQMLVHVIQEHRGVIVDDTARQRRAVVFA